MINRQQGFTLLEVMAALAIFSMLSVLAFMIFSQASELHQRSQKEIQQFNQQIGRASCRERVLYTV